MQLSEICQFLKDRDVEFVRFEQTDTHGISRSKKRASILETGLKGPVPAPNTLALKSSFRRAGF